MVVAIVLGREWSGDAHAERWSTKGGRTWGLIACKQATVLETLA